MMWAHALQRTCYSACVEKRGPFRGLSYDLYMDSRDRTQVAELVFWQVHSTLRAVSLVQLSDSFKTLTGARVWWFPPASSTLNTREVEAQRVAQV